MEGMNVKRHGFKGTRLYNIWIDMKQRCLNPKYPAFHRWGGKGVVVCEEWRLSFLSFREWALSNGYGEGLTIERIDGNGNYEPSNCRWATYKEQSRNTTSNHYIVIDGESRLLCDWLELSPITASTYHKRKKRGWSDKERCFPRRTQGGEQMAESIIQKDRQHCFICGMNTNLEPLDCHHVFGGANRNKSEQYGLKVYIHHSKCHIFGENSVHRNADIDRALKKILQKKAMSHYGWTIEDFRERFGKNYI